MNDSKIKIFFIIPIILLICFLAYIYITKGDLRVLDEETGVDSTKTYVENNFKLKGKYLGDNMWEYTVEGQLPNPCYSASVEVAVAESYPEQVTVSVHIVPPQGDLACTEVIEDFTKEGSFQASSEANIELKVEEPTSL